MQLGIMLVQQSAVVGCALGSKTSPPGKPIVQLDSCQVPMMVSILVSRCFLNPVKEQLLLHPQGYHAMLLWWQFIGKIVDCFCPFQVYMAPSATMKKQSSRERLPGYFLLKDLRVLFLKSMMSSSLGTHLPLLRQPRAITIANIVLESL